MILNKLLHLKSLATIVFKITKSLNFINQLLILIFITTRLKLMNSYVAV